MLVVILPLIAALTLSGAPGAKPGSSSRPDLSVSPRPTQLAVVYELDDGIISHRIFEEMSIELERLFEPANLQPVFRNLHARPPHEIYERLAVARFRGECSLSPVLFNSSDEPALGFTHVSDGQILPFVGVDCDRVQKLILPEIRGLPVAHQEVSFARALARVLAHELYHVLAETSEHGDSGVTKACLTAKELVQAELDIGEPEILRLRLKLQGR